MAARVTWLGHSTVLIELAGARLLTDPVLRSRLLHLRRVVPEVDPADHAVLDAVLVSHLHHDHLDTRSLSRLDRDGIRLVVPAGAGPLAAKQGFAEVTELAVGDRTRVGAVQVDAVRAVHHGGRVLDRTKVEALGFVTEADGVRIYFAGDTDLFDGMAEIRDLDLALVPVWGWGPRLGSGHLDPERAAEALALLRPRLAVPIHWGTFFPVGRRDRTRRLSAPPREFERAAAKLAPGVEIRVLEPGQAIDI
jgi:L-ascorbate metabolism protein UlaG (beta-lactamase superfamily)